MSYKFTTQYFRQEYLQRVAEGELLPKWSDSTAVSMLIQQMNKPRKQDCDFGEYSFFDIKWSDFLSGIFSLDETYDIDDSGLQIKVIDEQSCYNCLKHFIEQIKKSELKVSILEFLLKDEFRREILEKDYVAYRYSSHMIQEQCAIVLGEVNRVIHGFIAPDLANLSDDYGELEKEKKEEKTLTNRENAEHNENMKNTEETLTDEELEKFERFFEPRCISTYRTDLNIYKGCIFYDGLALCVLDTPWREDDIPCIPAMHACEEEMAKDKSTQIAQGIPAKIIAYILQTYPGYFTPGVDLKFLQYLEFCGDEYIEDDGNTMFMTNIDTEDLYLQHWAEFLSKDFKNPKSGEMGMDWEAIILMASGYIEALYKKTFRAGNCDPEPDTDFSIRVKINGYKDPLVLSTNKLWSETKRFEKYDSLPIYSIDLTDFDTWRYSIEDGFYKRGLLGFSAYTSALAIDANQMRPLTMDESFVLLDEDPDEHEKNDLSDSVEDNFCNINFINSLIKRSLDGEVDIDENSLSILNLKTLLFAVDVPKKQLFNEYLTVLKPSWKYIIAKLPTFPEALNQDDIFYSFILFTEQIFLKISQQSILWKTLVPCQQKILSDYSLRFQAYLKHEHKADITLIQEILDDESISIMELLAIHPDTIDMEEKKPNKENMNSIFEYISCDDKEQAQKIELELSQVIFKNAPAKVCDILLEYEQFMSYPKKLPDDIYSKLEKHFGNLGFTKEAFSRAWRRKTK